MTYMDSILETNGVKDSARKARKCHLLQILEYKRVNKLFGE